MSVILNNIFSFKADYVFPNGVKIEARKLKYLDDSSTSPDHDRDYINKFFIAMFYEKYLFKKSKKWNGKTFAFGEVEANKTLCNDQRYIKLKLEFLKKNMLKFVLNLQSCTSIVLCRTVAGM